MIAQFEQGKGNEERNKEAVERVEQGVIIQNICSVVNGIYSQEVG